MGKAQRLFKKWSKNIPTDARVQEVKTLLNHYFNGLWNQWKTSHIVVRCEKLKAFPDYQPYGEISVPVKGGQKVKGYYIKELIKAIGILEELGGGGNEEGS